MTDPASDSRQPAPGMSRVDPEATTTPHGDGIAAENVSSVPPVPNMSTDAGGLDGWIWHMFRVQPAPQPPPRVGSAPSPFGLWVQYVGNIVVAQWPFILCLALYNQLALGAQGVALAEREGWPSLLVTRYLGVWMMATGAALTYEIVERRWLAHIGHIAYRVPWLMVMGILTLAYGLAPGAPSNSWLGYGLLVTVAVGGLLITILLPIVNVENKADAVQSKASKLKRLAIACTVFVLPMVAGYLFTHFATTAPVGPLSATLMGLMALALGCQLLFVTLPAHWGSPLWALVVAAVIGLAILIWSPLPDRPNPLLTVNGDTAVPCASAPGPDNAGKRPLAITAEGGGMRAAYWTAVSLQRLSDELGEKFTSRIRVMSGVSGGSLGLATWLAAQKIEPPEKRLPAIQRFFSEDFLTPLLLGMLFVDAPRLVLPLATHRGDYFERTMAARWKEQTGYDFFTQRACSLTYNGGQVAVYFNATDAQTGEPIALGNRLAPAMPGADRSSKINHVIQERWAGITVAQAVHTSARFPYVSPHPDFIAPANLVAQAIGAVEKARPAGRTRLNDEARLATLVDGGYFDNSGLGPVIELLQRGSSLGSPEERESAAAAARQWSMLHISSDWERGCANSNAAKSKEAGLSQSASVHDNAAKRLLTSCEQKAGHRLAEAEKKASWGWVTRPMDAIFAVRGAHSLQRINELRATLRTLHGANPLPLTEVTLPAPTRFAGAGFEDEVPLVWTLSTQHRQTLDLHAEEVARAVAKELLASK
jgi:hypothetical protein